MITIQAIRIHDFRGIRDLTLDMREENFVISGPNGSGKSGVVDAIEFALTGDIRRLEGTGSGELRLSEHGPHVNKRSYPDSSWVELNFSIPGLGKAASVLRRISKPRQAKIIPDDPDIAAILAEVGAHPEITLSRREIVKFILNPAAQRSRDVQTLLKLDDIGHTRATLKTTENRLNAEHLAAKAVADSAAASLLRHLDLPELKAEDLLAAANQRRRVLGLPTIEKLTKETCVTEGLVEAAGAGSGAQTKDSALADLSALADAAAGRVEKSLQAAIGSLQVALARIQADPGLAASMRSRSLVQAGLDLIDGPQCPLCDVPWEDIGALRAHLQAKMEKAKEAEALQSRILESARALATEILKVRVSVEAVARLPECTTDELPRLSTWSADLLAFSHSLSTVESVISQQHRFDSRWAGAPEGTAADVQSMTDKVKARPDIGAANDARDFLVLAQERLSTWRSARREVERKGQSASRGRIAYKTYCDVAEVTLSALYDDVEAEFSAYYRFLNHDDEGEFKAKFEPSEGKLGLVVDFHGKGMFPPGAYHSEGHQDGMGVCLYLALMKRVLGSAFTVAVLDDVVMSVDRQHRKQFCRLLKTHFPKTQFVITTHDEVWARQIRSEGLVGAKATVAFHTWTVETGPVLDEVAEVWTQIDSDLAKNDVPAAAGRLRRHLEYVAAELADRLAAKVKFRGDGGYDMGELLGAVIGCQRDLLKQAAKAARSWGNVEELARVEECQKQRAAMLAAKGGEDWILNTAIHYNEWADLSKEDFDPAVRALQSLLQQFRCDKPKCESWFYVAPRIEPEELRCSCGAFHLNLKEK